MFKFHVRIDQMDNRIHPKHALSTLAASLSSAQSPHLTSLMLLALEFWILFFFPIPCLKNIKQQ